MFSSSKALFYFLGGGILRALPPGGPPNLFKIIISHIPVSSSYFSMFSSSKVLF